MTHNNSPWLASAGLNGRRALRFPWDTRRRSRRRVLGLVWLYPVVVWDSQALRHSTGCYIYLCELCLVSNYNDPNSTYMQSHSPLSWWICVFGHLCGTPFYSSCCYCYHFAFAPMPRFNTADFFTFILCDVTDIPVWPVKVPVSLNYTSIAFPTCQPSRIYRQLGIISNSLISTQHS